MAAVIICGMINSGLLVGLVAGIVVGVARARFAIGGAISGVIGGDGAHPLVVRGRQIPA